MDDVEAIKRLKARYFRTMDTKDWAAMRGVFTDDVVVDTTESGGGHTPEIDLVSPTTATGIWALQDILKWPNGTELHGFGHYYETYVKIGDEWRIATTKLTRLHMDFTPPDA